MNTFVMSRYGLHPWKPASVLWLPATIGEQRVSRTLAMHARERLLPQTALSRAQRWLYDGTVWAHPQLAAVIHSGDGEAGDVERGNSAAMAGSAPLTCPPKLPMKATYAVCTCGND